MSKIMIASGPVIIEDNRVLLTKHGADEFWKFCGGRVDETEVDIKETAIRRAGEELGLEIEILNDQPFFYYVEKEIGGARASIILAHFLAKRQSEVVPGPETREWRWIDINELDKENLAPNIRPTLEYFNFLK